MLPASIPSPDVAVWSLGPIPIRAYALCLLAGIVVATWVTARRLPARGIEADRAVDIALWAVPFGIVGGRLYHVLSSPQAYFGPGGDPIRAFYLWEGGLGIWGAVALGALGVWFACRRLDVGFLPFVDAIVPGLALAQAVGRWGNWFNNELYGAPTDLPWALEIHQWDHGSGRAVVDASGAPVLLGTYHPTFLYESLWCLCVVGLLLWLEARRGRRLRPGQLAAAYVMLYTLGRAVVENVRVDEANHLLGLRLNVWTSIVVFAFGVWWFWWSARRGDAALDAPSKPSTLGDVAAASEGAAREERGPDAADGHGRPADKEARPPYRSADD